MSKFAEYIKESKSLDEKKKKKDDWEDGVGINEDELNERLIKKMVIRKGKKVKKWKSSRPGYRTVMDKGTGRPKEVRMLPSEIRKRKKGQRMGKIKRKARQAQAKLKTKMSKRKRKSLLGRR